MTLTTMATFEALTLPLQTTTRPLSYSAMNRLPGSRLVACACDCVLKYRTGLPATTGPRGVYRMQLVNVMQPVVIGGARRRRARGTLLRQATCLMQTETLSAMCFARPIRRPPTSNLATRDATGSGQPTLPRLATRRLEQHRTGRQQRRYSTTYRHRDRLRRDSTLGHLGAGNWLSATN